MGGHDGANLGDQNVLDTLIHRSALGSVLGMKVLVMR